MTICAFIHPSQHSSVMWWSSFDWRFVLRSSPSTLMSGTFDALWIMCRKIFYSIVSPSVSHSCSCYTTEKRENWKFYNLSRLLKRKPRNLPSIVGQENAVKIPAFELTMAPFFDSYRFWRFWYVWMMSIKSVCLCESASKESDWKYHRELLLNWSVFITVRYILGVAYSAGVLQCLNP